MSRTPEHDKRDMDGGLHPDVEAAYDYVSGLSVTTVDGCNGNAPFWHGWAIREAFLAGISYAASPDP